MTNQPLVLDGKALAREVEANLRERVARLREKTGQTPVLATILVGSNPASVTYVNMKSNACARVGIESARVELPEATTTGELVQAIEKLNQDDRICGILLQHPVPRQIDEQKCFNTIALGSDR
jgi:methylenetetrahydrofolate dehydrogenase (NADP+) / methenyltetrahydrofolate cyclohydrolase